MIFLYRRIKIHTYKQTYTAFNPTQRFVLLHGGGLFPGTLLTGNIHQKSFPPLLISRWQRERNSSNPPCAVRITVKNSTLTEWGPSVSLYLGDFPAPPIVWISRETGGVVGAAGSGGGADTGRCRDAGVSVDLAQLQEFEAPPFWSLSEEARLRGELKD